MREEELIKRLEIMLEHLHSYEETGLEPWEIKILKRKNTPMRVKDIHCDEYFCPACWNENTCDQHRVTDRFCPMCGQRLEVENDGDHS